MVLGHVLAETLVTRIVHQKQMSVSTFLWCHKRCRITKVGNYSAADINQRCYSIMLNLASATTKQTNSTLWHTHRQGRITASKAYRILSKTLQMLYTRSCNSRQMILQTSLQ